ncbi:NIPSNAP family protein [Croceivirga thetidis]|uniref:NIPSNAP family containing protein n=1 Tax=Croceivirga thetidis TaxID=2721623 RepID=A0ABX1GRD1_9FLAO|nr:NIPSNAP family protein [Croceivirga thetidis]NKI32507.1 NIPSNAP family containing protein [Croceivirga thetidis]
MKLHKVIATLSFFVALSINAQDQVYELRTYEIGFFKNADVLLNYFEDALIPALNRQGVEGIGVFEETSQAMPRKIYLLLPYPTISAYQNSVDALEADEAYQTAANSYLKAAPNTMPYDRFKSDLISSTKGFPSLQPPAEGKDFLELRIYNSYNEDALRRKVKMFQSEFAIFKDAGLGMVFFGYNIAGDNMPCLTYLLAVEDMDAHNEGWAKFVQHPQWKALLADQQYANSMNEIVRVFLKPLAFSQL